MAIFFIRDDESDTGFRVVPGPLARSREESYVPWAITRQNQVVYARTGAHRNKPSKAGLSPYDSIISRKRRALCHSDLGLIALQNESISRQAIARVSAGVKRFLELALSQGELEAKSLYAARVGKYMYGLRYCSFGRFSDTVPTGPLKERKIWMDAMAALDNGAPLATVLRRC